MSLKFIYTDYSKGNISTGNLKLNTTDGGCVTIGICNYYHSSYPTENKENQLNKIRKLLEGEICEGTGPIFANNNGVSSFSIDFENDIFILNGGAFGPTFGDICTISCSYKNNKNEIDKFMRFMIDDL